MMFEKIMVVDDNPRVKKSLEIAMPEYEFIEFSDGKTAVEYLRNVQDVNLVLLDIYMKDANGIEVLKEIKQIAPKVAVIIITAFGSQDVAVQALRNHADDFLDKPFDISLLREKINEFLKPKNIAFGMGLSSDGQIERIKRYIVRHPEKSTLEHIAQILGYHPKYVSRIFSEKNGLGLRHFKSKIKAGLAKKLLATTTLTVRQISYDLGYQNPESFMRFFKAFTGVTPKQYRKRNSDC